MKEKGCSAAREMLQASEKDNSTSRVPLAKGEHKTLKDSYAVHTLWGKQSRGDEFLRRMWCFARAQVFKLRAGSKTNCEVLREMWNAPLHTSPTSCQFSVISCQSPAPST